MQKPVKILHIDPDFQVYYVIVREGSLIHSTVSLEKAVLLLKTIEFDLILSEPHQKAILSPRSLGNDRADEFGPSLRKAS